jgi:hypothetical protein
VGQTLNRWASSDETPARLESDAAVDHQFAQCPMQARPLDGDAALPSGRGRSIGTLASRLPLALDKMTWVVGEGGGQRRLGEIERAQHAQTIGGNVTYEPISADRGGAS